MYDYSTAGDYHVHPDFSFDARGTLDEFCRAAIAKGLSEICFTTHYDTDPRLPESHRIIKLNGDLRPQSVAAMADYVKAVAAIRDKYCFEGLEVKCGVEVGFYPGCEEETARLFAAHDFDFRLGAVHRVDEIDICNDESMRATAEKYSLDEFADKYYEVIRRIVTSGLFDAVAHLDMYKWYGLKHYGDEINKIHLGRLEPILELMKEQEMGFELNTAAVRKGHPEYYPTMEIVNFCRRLGVPIASIGSDAHCPDEVAFEFDLARIIAHETVPYVDE